MTNADVKQPICTNHSFVLGWLSNASWWTSTLTPFLKWKKKKRKKKNINVTVPVKFDTRQLSIQHVLLVKVRTTRQIWRNFGVLSSAVGVTRDFYAWQFNFNASLSWHHELKPGPTKHNNNNNALQRQHKPRPATRHFQEEYCQVTSKLKHYELQPRPATHKPKYYVNNRANSRTSPISPALLGQTGILAGRSTEKTGK